jgi:hypothetical protein
MACDCIHRPCYAINVSLINDVHLFVILLTRWNDKMTHGYLTSDHPELNHCCAYMLTLSSKVYISFHFLLYMGWITYIQKQKCVIEIKVHTVWWLIAKLLLQWGDIKFTDDLTVHLLDRFPSFNMFSVVKNDSFG